MTTRENYLESITEMIQDYREGEVPRPTPHHVARWVSQFPVASQDGILSEIDYVLKLTYFSREKIDHFLEDVINSEKLSGSDICSSWIRRGLLNIQSAGSSQREMLSRFENILKNRCSLTRADCGHGTQEFVYLDDGVFTGCRFFQDLSSWIGQAPKQLTLHVITIALHRGGHYYYGDRLRQAAAKAGIKLDLRWWRCLELEDRKTYIDSSDVLRPTQIPEDPATQAYVATLQYAPRLRTPGQVGENRLFSSEEGRSLLEQEFLTAGITIRNQSPNLTKYQRPLGNMVLETLGFGTMVITHRNCPNNAPLALWAGNPWYPLFPRRTN